MDKNFNVKDWYKMFVQNDFGLFEKFITDYGLNCAEIKDKRNLLMYSILDNKNEYAVELLNRGIDINYQDKVGYSALHYAAQENNLEIVNLLITNGATIDIKDSYGETPLWCALSKQKQIDNQIIISLLEAGANINVKNNYGLALKTFVDKTAIYYSYIKKVRKK